MAAIATATAAISCPTRLSLSTTSSADRGCFFAMSSTSRCVARTTMTQLSAAVLYKMMDRSMASERGSPAGEMRLAALNERFGRLAVILGQAGTDVVRDLDVHALAEFAGHGPVEVFLHVAVGDARAAGQAPCPLSYLVVEVRGGEHRVDDPEALGGCCRQPFREVVQLLGHGGADQAGQEP